MLDRRPGPGRRSRGAGGAGRSRLVPGLDRGRPDAVQLVRRARPARRTVPDDRAEPGRRSGRPHRRWPGAGADRDALRAHPHRRRRLPVHPLCQSLSRAARMRAGTGPRWGSPRLRGRAAQDVSAGMATVVGMSRHAAIATSLIVVTGLLAGCAPGLAANPRFATNAGARPHGKATTAKPPKGPPPIAAPKNDLSWRDCTSKEFSDAAVPAAPGVKLDCASYDADLDPVNGAAGTLSIGVVRARSVQTPRDAGPLVLTTGSDLPSSLQLPVWLGGAGGRRVQKHPIVAVARRGMGTSSPVDCLDQFDRQEIRDQSQFEAGNDPVANLADIVQNATTSCTDTIAPGDSAYDDTHAATDIERLRSIWDVLALALIGIGSGAQVALSYASSHPDKDARLVLRSPLALDG